MSHWQGHPVSSGGWCLIDHVDRVTLSAVEVMSYWPCWQGRPVSSGGWCLIDRVALSAVVVDVLLTMLIESPCQQWRLMSYWLCWQSPLSVVGDNVLLTGSPCQQWVLMSYWQGRPVSSGGWCLIDHVDRVALSAVEVDVSLTGSPCQQWRLMSYWPCWQGRPVSSGVWCLIDKVTLSAVVSLNIFISQLEQYPKVIHCGSSRGGDVYHADL